MLYTLYYSLFNLPFKFLFSILSNFKMQDLDNLKDLALDNGVEDIEPDNYSQSENMKLLSFIPPTAASNDPSFVANILSPFSPTVISASTQLFSSEDSRDL